MKLLRFGYHYHSPYYFDGDKIRMASVQGLFLDELAKSCGELVCFLYEAKEAEKKYLDYEITEQNIKIVSMGPHDSVPRRLVRALIFRGALKKSLSNLNFLMVRGPSPLLPWFALNRQVPCGMLLVGDWTQQFEWMKRGILKRAAVNLWVRWNKHRQTQALCKSLVLTNNQEILRSVDGMASKAVLVSTSLVSEKDVYVREDTCGVRPVKILYSGRIARSKGIEDLLEGLSVVRAEGLDAVLDIIGPAEKSDDLNERLPELIRKWNLVKEVRVHGFIPRGPVFFDLYRQADMLVVPSRASEGFPRVIWEAMAAGLPVIATKVVSGSGMVEDRKNILLCDSSKPEKISEAILELVENQDLRRSLIACAYESVKEKTLEASAAHICREAVSWLLSRKIEPSKEKRLLFIGNFIESTRIKSPFEELCYELQRQGWAVKKVSGVKNRLFRAADMAWTLCRKSKDYERAVIAVYSGPAFCWAEMSVKLLKLLRKPFVVALHGGELPEFAVRCPKRFTKLLADASAIVTPSEYLKEKLSCYGAEIKYVPNGIRLTGFPYKVRTSASPRICWVRAFHKIYDPELALKVIVLLRKKFPQIQLCLIGPDSGDGTLQKIRGLISSFNLESCVRIEGSVRNRELFKYFESSDIFLNTTTAESFGLSVMEAASSGLCIVSSRAGEIPRLWEDGVNALLFEVGNAQQAASAIEKILTEPHLAQKLSMEARKKAEEFGWEHIVPVWENLLLKIPGRPGE